MRIEYDPSLVEQATFLAIRKSPQDEAAFRRARESVYALRDSEQRDEGFRRISSQWFLKLALGEPLRLLIAERPLIEQCVECCFVREAFGARKQAADLYVKMSADGASRTCTLIVGLCPETLLAPGDLAATLRTDLLKVSDMLDEAFAYSPEAPSANRPRQNLIRDRYRALWDIYVTSRLRLEKRHAERHEHIARNRFIQAFTSQGRPPNAACCDALMRMSRPNHSQLLQWAMTPHTLPEWSSAESDHEQPGQACPLCGFPTYDWYPAEMLEQALVDQMAEILPSWGLQSGMCRQCVETLRSSRISLQHQDS